MKSLSERAKEIRLRSASGKEYSNEEIDLAVAWLTGEVRTTQVAKAMEFKQSSRGSVYNFLANALKQGIEKGRFEIVKGKHDPLK